MEKFNDRNYDAWRTHHWTDEPEQDLPEIDDPRVVEVWEEAEDRGDGHPLPRYAKVRVKFKPWLDDDYTEELSYYDYLDNYASPKLEEAWGLMRQLSASLGTALEKLKQLPLGE